MWQLKGLETAVKVTIGLGNGGKFVVFDEG
jgi:hypothetical protein